MKIVGVTNTGQGDSSEDSRSSQIWLRWVFPEIRPATLLQGSLCIGRDPSCDVHLEDGGVSRKHVEISREGPIFALRDLSSKNGTSVNGKRVHHCAISQGMVMRVGDHVGVFTNH